MQRFKAFLEAVLSDFGQAGKMLSRQGDLLELTNSMGETALHFLAVENRLDEVRWLAEQGAGLDPHTALLGTTPLTDAAMLGHLEMVELLLDLGAFPGSTDRRGRSCLHHAAAQGRLEVVELLLEAVPELVHCGGEEGTPLHAAAAAGHTQICGLLLEHGARAQTLNRQGESALMLLSVDSLETVMLFQQHGAPLDGADNLGRGLLHHAAARGLAELCRYYLGQGLDAQVRDLQGHTPQQLVGRLWPDRPVGEDGWPLDGSPPTPAERAALAQRAENWVLERHED